jgi:hypothetical protein
MTDDMDVIAKLADRPNDTQGLTAAQLKARFDKSGVDIQDYINNTLLPYLESDAAAGNMGIDPITGLDAETVQAALEEIYADRDVVWATYGTTTYADVRTAHEAGKLVAIDNGSNTYLLTYCSLPELQEPIVFLSFYHNAGIDRIYWAQVDKNNAWTTSYKDVPRPDTGSANTPYMDGVRDVGSAYSYARADHRHPSDTSKADVADVPTKTSDLTNDSGFITAADVPEEVFWATYGTTTYSEIGTALTAGKLVMCEYSGIYYTYHYRAINTRYFASEGGYWLSVTSGNVWSQGQSSGPSAATATPLMDGVGAVGSSFKYAKEDHVHPSDTTKITMPGSGTTGQVLKKTADGVEWANESGGGSSIDPYTSNPAALGNFASPGVSDDYARGDHVHPKPSAAELGITVPSAYTSNPVMDGTASAGSSTSYAKGDHVHPSDTSKITMPSGGSAGQVLKKTADGVEWANESGGGTTEVYWATYGTTTNAEIDTAYNAGKVVLVEHNDMIASLTMISVGDDYADFCAAYGNFLYTISCESDSWSTTYKHISPDKTTNASTGAVTQALDAEHVYHFTGALTSLTITLNAASGGDLAHYHFDFDSGSTAPTLTLPNTVTMPSGFQVEANKHYEIDILDGYGAAQSW